MDGEFSFTAADLDRGGKSYRFALTTSWLARALTERAPESDEALPGAQQAADAPTIGAGDKDGVVEVRASRSDKEVIVHGHASGCLKLACARCLQPFTQELHVEIAGLFVPKSKLRADHGPEYEFSAAEAEIEAYDGETVVLDTLVLDSLLLDIPMIPLCSDDCPGMSAASDGSVEPEKPAIDPRLLPLMRFKGSA